MASKREGRIHIFTGNGRGKTSAALGTVMRAAGYGLKVYIVFFMKGKHKYGEYRMLTQMTGVDWDIFGRSSFLGPEDITEKDRTLASRAFKAAGEAILGGKYDLVVMDEVNPACHWSLVSLDDLVALIKNKPDGVELILTGRYAHPRLIELADQVTELKNIKHSYDKGLKPKRGIDF